MKRLIPFLLILLLFTSCVPIDNEDLDMGENGDKNNSNIKENDKIDMNVFLNNSTIPYNNDEIEPNLNLLNISEDVKMTISAANDGIAEYDVLIEAFSLDSKLTGVPQTSLGTSYSILSEYSTKLPDILKKNTIYEIYKTAFNYIILLGDDVNIRQKPTSTSIVIGQAHSLEKINLLSVVKGQYLANYDSNIWYEIAYNDLGTIKRGFIFGALAEQREFRLEEMLSKAIELKNEFDNNLTGVISNYRNRNGEAPSFVDYDYDDYGINRYQSAPAYIEPNLDSQFRYITDGTIVTINEEKDDYYYISTTSFEGNYYVPKKYISSAFSNKILRQFVVVDIKNQNQAVLRNYRNEWELISYTYNTTSQIGSIKSSTAPGSYMIMNKREKLMDSVNDNEEPNGYAPYALRYSSDSYIYGIPVQYTGDEEADDKTIEYLFTMGTIPRAQRGVRNYTSHAKFLYEWLEVGESAVIVLE